MKILLTVAAAFLLIGCGEGDLNSDETSVCNTTFECNDREEANCQDPVNTKFSDGTTLEVRACTYITTEQCFESTRCEPTIKLK